MTRDLWQVTHVLNTNLVGVFDIFVWKESVWLVVVQGGFWPFPDQGWLVVLAALILASQLQNYGSSSVADLNGQIWTFLSDFLRSSIAWADLKTCTLLIFHPGNLHKNWAVSCLQTPEQGGPGQEGQAVTQQPSLTPVMMDDNIFNDDLLREGDPIWRIAWWLWACWEPNITYCKSSISYMHLASILEVHADHVHSLSLSLSLSISLGVRC